MQRPSFIIREVRFFGAVCDTKNFEFYSRDLKWGICVSYICNPSKKIKLQASVVFFRIFRLLELRLFDMISLRYVYHTYEKSNAICKG